MASSAPVAQCPHCHHSNPAGTTHCVVCRTPIAFEEMDMTAAIGEGWSAAGPVGVPTISTKELVPGSVLAERYEILNKLGEGGMGTVYKARDRELDRLVALKAIRPELAGHAKILARFKQELILARQVTHRNVIRIFDIGMAEGTRFITMEYVEGRDLSEVMQERRLSVEETVKIMRQVCGALEAAHAEGVIHRDLKPHNIMLDDRAKVFVMDFGLARSMEAPGLTQTGVVLGTPTYMSPEQAKGEPVDARSDIFALGIILYEMLSGKAPFQADTVLATLLKRTQAPPPPLAEVDPAVPPFLSEMVQRCLAVDPAQRYQSASEVLAELEGMFGKRSRTSISAPAPVAVPASHFAAKWKWVAIGAGALLLLAAGGFLLKQQLATPPVETGKPVTVLVADFQNTTGDPIFDGTIEPTFTLALEGAKFITSYNRVQARRIAGQVQAGATVLDPTVARLVAVREGIAVVVAGSIRRQSSDYVVSVRAIDAVNGKEIASRETPPSGKQDVLPAVGKLAAPVRRALGDATPESVQIAAAETFTAASLEAAQNYAVAQELRFSGKVRDAIPKYIRAVELDPNLSSAYAALAAAYANLGQRPEAEKYYQLAMAKIDRMSDREKYRNRGSYYLAVKNQEKAIEEFGALVKQYPADFAGLNNLSVAYYLRRDMAKALEQGRRGLEIYPKNALLRTNVAHYAMYAGDFETAARDAGAVIETNPSYLKAYLALALSELAQGKLDAAAGAYRRLEGVGTAESSFAAGGLADLLLYQGQLSEASALLEKSALADLGAKNPAGAAKKFAALASVLWLRGQKAPALQAADRAIDGSSETSALFPAARVYLQAGQEAKAREVARQLARQLERDPQAYAKLIEGEALLKRGSAREAITLFQEAQKLSDTWLGRFDLGLAYLEARAFTEADSEFDVCLKRRGEATEVFLDEVPTYHYVPPIHYYLGRAREGLKSPGAADSFKAFLAIKQKAEDEPMVLDARRRLAAK